MSNRAEGTFEIINVQGLHARPATRLVQTASKFKCTVQFEHAGQVVPQLARALVDGADLFAHVLCDLTGFDLLGEHASAAACMDAVAIVGRTGRTRVGQLRHLARAMPAERFLGVLLVGGAGAA